MLKRAALIDAARKRDWTKLPGDACLHQRSKARRRVFATSLIRLISAVAGPEDPAGSCSARPKTRRPSCAAQRSRRWDSIPTTESLQALVDGNGR
ncbi:MAG: hypothetical protein M0C28_32805 [Candidatus Moduliflexus flocculans]|nr:hypothetical protein [Candidatus Moduliflexus flocculans]